MQLTSTPFRLCLLGLFTLTACSNSGRYQIAQDHAPNETPDVSTVENAHPKYEPYSKGGNKDYSVFGKSYKVLKTGANYTETGTASWYGAKFHGHKTSNGETYDMYSMSAAHKNLPLPSYARITNLDNQQQVIVRVNDRGPFHGNRIVDVSYSAAYKLGMLKTGTARVKLEVIHFDSPTSTVVETLKESDQVQYLIQVLASSDKKKLEIISNELARKYAMDSSIMPYKTFYRLQLGPISSKALADSFLGKIKQDGFEQSFILQSVKK